MTQHQPRRSAARAVALVAILLGSAVSAAPRTAECAGCPPYTCYGKDSCGSVCPCLRRGIEIGGVCVTIDRARGEQR